MRNTSLVPAILIAVFMSDIRADAEIIHFTNPAPGQPGHYDWHVETTDGWQSWLDITVGPNQQSNEANGNSVAQRWFGFVSQFGAWAVNLTGGGAEVLAGFGPGAPAGPPNTPYTRSLLFGDPLEAWYIPPDPDNKWFGGWVDFSSSATHVYSGGLPNAWSYLFGGYIGVRTQSGHYGWIHYERTSFWNLRALEWAYETTPDVPIYAGQIPAPGTLAVLALGAILTSSRRRAINNWDKRPGFYLFLCKGELR